ncbi:hypothetical protein SEA_NICEHOUSE_24 [Rhodococcus phage NiceHouse]|nr:hypothetical protein SEA_NICEHOUSE_24 [Rhodococcus phage NiceHouse]
MKKKTLVIGVAIMAALMAGCGVQPEQKSQEKISDLTNIPTYKVYLQEGGYLRCVYLEQSGEYGGTGGPTCDWSNAK